jgi:hypothetical protein
VPDLHRKPVSDSLIIIDGKPAAKLQRPVE